MSILLDALKKSEAQRQLGQAPTLRDEAGAATAPADFAQQWLPLTLMALAAIAMAWIGWQQMREPPGLASAGPEPVVVTREDAPQAASAEREVVAPGEAVAEPPVSAPGAEEAPGVEASPRSRTPVESYSERRGSLRSITVLPPPQDVTASAAATPDRSATAAPAAPEEAAAQPRRARQPAAAVAPAETGGPISFWELPQGVRDSLPELRITVLVYAEQPEDRFVLIGGERLRENDEVQQGVLLEEIRREGAVFRYRSYRFLVKG